VKKGNLRARGGPSLVSALDNGSREPGILRVPHFFPPGSNFCTSEKISRKIRLVGFGTFSVGTRAQREGRNPGTGAKIKIPAKKVVKFKAGKTLSEKVK